MTSHLSVLCILVFSGCDQTPQFGAERECVESDRAAANAAIIACAEAANPKSDEEGEDLVAECRRTMRDSLCLRWEWFVTKPQCSGCIVDRVALCARGTEAQKRACLDQGWKP